MFTQLKYMYIANTAQNPDSQSIRYKCCFNQGLDFWEVAPKSQLAVKIRSSFWLVDGRQHSHDKCI